MAAIIGVTLASISCIVCVHVCTFVGGGLNFSGNFYDGGGGERAGEVVESKEQTQHLNCCISTTSNI